MSNNYLSLILPLIAAALSALGQISLKYAMLKHGSIELNIKGIASLILEPSLLLAIMIYSVAMLMWLQVLSKIPLSTAYPILAVTYILVPFLAYAVFGESIGKNQLIGMLLILAGVTMMGKI